jgi:hypothetical protein
MRPRAVAALFAACLSACALVADLGTEYGAPSVADDGDASAPDGVVAPLDAADHVRADVTPPPDAPLEDAPAHDTGPDVTDGYVKPDTGGDPGCGPLGQHDFCDSFDDPGKLGLKWDEKLGSAGQTSSPTPPLTAPFCVQFQVAGATDDSHLLIGRDPAPMRRVVLNAQLQSDIKSMPSGTTLELARIVAVDDSGTELGGAYFLASSTNIQFHVCDRTACGFEDQTSIPSSTGWHTFHLEVTFGASTVAAAWTAYGALKTVGSAGITYGGTVTKVRTVIGLKGATGGWSAYWDDATIDWY